MSLDLYTFREKNDIFLLHYRRLVVGGFFDMSGYFEFSILFIFSIYFSTELSLNKSSLSLPKFN